MPVDMYLWIEVVLCGFDSVAYTSVGFCVAVLS